MAQTYDEQKFLRYISTDMFLDRTWERRQQDLPVECHAKYLLAMFNSYVVDNAEATMEYEAS